MIDLKIAVKKMSVKEYKRFVLAVAASFSYSTPADAESMRRFYDQTRMLMEDFRLIEG